MTLNSQEHVDLMSMFERIYKGRMDKEEKRFWKSGRVYQDGQINELFLAFRQGAAYGKALARN